MKELLRQIGIDLPGYYSKPDTYVIDLDSADEYSRIFAKLDKTDLVDEVEESSVSNVSVSNVMYTNDEYLLNIIADFDNDTYRLVVHKL